jgi:hypothetical protein
MGFASQGIVLDVRVYRFLLRFVDKSTAEDLVNEVFLDVWRQAGRFQGRSQVTTWLLAIARNKALLGKDVPFATGNQNESIIALKDGKMINFVVPYPMGFYAKTMDGRIDDPNGGWKGRGIWASAGNRTPFHVEGGKGTLPKLVKFQLRPDPLAH